MSARHPDANYGRALAKVRHHDEGVWYGQLQPAEIVALVRHGAKPPPITDHAWQNGRLTRFTVYPAEDQYAKRAEEHVRAGQSGCGAYYFRPSEEILADLRSRGKLK